MTFMTTFYIMRSFTRTLKKFNMAFGENILTSLFYRIIIFFSKTFYANLKSYIIFFLHREYFKPQKLKLEAQIVSENCLHSLH